MPQGKLMDSYITALGIVDDVITSHSLNDNRPSLLHHYTSLDVGQKILTNKEIRLSHCEYSNDADEIRKSILIIHKEIEELISKSSTYQKERDFYNSVLASFDSRTSLYEAFVFCMSEGDRTKYLSNQDILSLWRAYGSDGRGICLSFDSGAFDISSNQSSFRLSRIIYDEILQERVIKNILDKGWKNFSSSVSAKSGENVTATVVALMFFLPTMKHEAFREEREWRFIYVPEPEEKDFSERQFHARTDGLLVPYYTYGGKSNILPLIVELMVGPSPYQELSLRSLEFIRGQATPRASDIPYRSQVK